MNDVTRELVDEYNTNNLNIVCGTNIDYSQIPFQIYSYSFIVLNNLHAIVFLTV